MSDTQSTRALDIGLLLLRLGAGISLLLLFGVTKVKSGVHFLHTGEWSFVDFNRKVGLPLPVLAAWLQTLNESLGAGLVALGWFTRPAAVCLALGFAVAAACSLKMGERAWLFAAYFFLMFATLALTGPGRYALDSLRGRKRP